MEQEKTTISTALDIPGVNNNALSEIQKMWKLSPLAMSKVRQSALTSNSRYSLLANIPIKCNGDQCPYVGTCPIDILGLPVGERCPVEIATLLTRFEKYCNELEITDDMPVDMGQVKELIDLEVMILRCDSKMAMNVDFIEDSLVDVTKTGVYIYEKKVTQEAQFKITLYERHSKILKDLNASRASKKEANILDDASKAAATIVRRIKEVSTANGATMDDVLDANYRVDEDEYVITEDDYCSEQYSDSPEYATEASSDNCTTSCD